LRPSSFRYDSNDNIFFLLFSVFYQDAVSLSKTVHTIVTSFFYIGRRRHSSTLGLDCGRLSIGTILIIIIRIPIMFLVLPLRSVSVTMYHHTEFKTVMLKVSCAPK